MPRRSRSSSTGQEGAPHLTDRELLAFLQWNLSRYDGLRASTSTRASVLLSANVALTAGTIVSTKSTLQGFDRLGIPGVALGALAAITIVLSLTSIGLAICAIATWRTTRSIHGNEIPSRFIFNWGDTLRAVDGVSSFEQAILEASCEELVLYATRELWTSILQHRRRHKFLRWGIHAFRLAVLCFAAVTTLVLV
jgi:hypothetical protein